MDAIKGREILEINSGSQNLSMGEADARFLASLSPEEGMTSHHEVHKFVRWYGTERHFAGLTAHEVANYAERLSSSDTNYVNKLGMVRAFLAYAKKQGWSKTNLATHLKIRKSRTGLSVLSRQVPAETISLTRQRYAELEADLATLQDKRVQIINEMSRAAADKDFRENAPLQAAREQYGHLAGRIQEVEEDLKLAVIIKEKTEANRQVGVGDSVVLSDLVSGEEWSYMIVSPNEVDPTKGKISSASPLGKAIVGQRPGAIVEIKAPAGKLSYRLKQIGL